MSDNEPTSGSEKVQALVVTDRRSSAMERSEEQGASTSPGGLLLAAIRQGMPTEQLQLFLDHHQRAIEDQRRAAYTEAMATAQGMYVAPRKHARSDRGMFAPMDEDAESIRAGNAAAGLSYKHKVSSVVRDDGHSALVRVQCIVMHKDGHEEAAEPMETVAAEEKGMSLIRAIKSATTFLRRLTLEAAFGIAPTDDDDGRGTPKPSYANRGQGQPPKSDPKPQTREASQPKAKKDKPIEERRTDVIRAFAPMLITQDNLEDYLSGDGEPAHAVDDWTDDDLDKRLTDLYKALHRSTPDHRVNVFNSIMGMPHDRRMAYVKAEASKK